MDVAMAFLSKYWKYIAIGAIVLVGWLYIQSLRSEIISQQSTIATLSAENKTLTSNNAILQAALTTQNTAIEKISDLATDTKARFDLLGVNVQQQTSSLDVKLQNLMKEKRPTTCEETIQYLIAAGKGYKK